VSEVRDVNGSTSRRKAIALVLSGIFPGLGQFYNHEPVKGAAFAASGGVLSWLAGRAFPVDLLVQNLLLTQDRLPVENLLVVALILPLCLLLIVWFWSLIDAWRVAGR
jgi:TM2 domain-containing membrane protein YozV